MSTVHGFELVEEQDITELRAKARLYRHVQTGARLLSLVNDDENKVFSITFRTPPSDSTGVPHILEHSVLCGSRKYPVKEPFIELAKGSLKTFLNAFTYPDKTCYPVASTNLQDFYNLIDVYLDCVFYPQITRHTLDQEGWHYELDNVDDPLIYKGVVFNEMKGSYASPDTVLYDTIQASLYPDNTYAHDAGGDPKAIPDLTYEQFKAFHETFYHPSNAFIYFYGDDNPDERLRLLDAWLKDFQPIPVASEVALQSRFDQPARVVKPYAVDPDTDTSKKTIVTVNWMVDEVRDPALALALDILSHILVATPASPLRKALIDSGLGEEVTGGGYADYLRQTSFSTGLKGVARADADKVEQLVLDTLKTLVEQGIDSEMVEAAMNTTEFQLRENNTGGYPRGLALMLWSLNTWLHGGDPLAPLRFEAPLNSLKARLAAGARVFEEMIDCYLVTNPHRATVILEPDPTLGPQEEAAERARLDQVRAGMTREALEAVVENTRLLKELQDTPDSPEALATIPHLALSDLERENKPIPIDVQERQGVKVLYHDLFTNGIVYLDVALDLRPLAPTLLPYLPLFGRALTEMGTATEDYVKLAQRIGRKTGGVWTNIDNTMTWGAQEPLSHLFLRGKAMPSQLPDLLDIMRDVLLTVRLDNQERFKQMVLEQKVRREQGLIQSGHAVVATRLSAHFNAADWASEQMSGLTNLFFLRDLAQKVDQDWPAVRDALEQIRATVVNRASMLCNVTVDETTWGTVAPQLEQFLAALPVQPASRRAWSRDGQTENEAFIIPGQINYVGKGIDLYQHGYRYDGSLQVINQYMRTTWLWEKIRVKGGAYGAFNGFSRYSGVYNMLSYRDPNLLPTLEVYDQTPHFLRTVDLSEEELTRSIIGAISAMDAYMLPDAKGWVSMQRYLTGDTDALRQQMRDEALSTTVQDFRAFADTLDELKDHGIVKALGSQTAIESVTSNRPGWLAVSRVGL